MLFARNRIAVFPLALAGFFSLCIALYLSRAPVLPVFSAGERPQKPVYVVDAGHGGEDGGALSAKGEKESDINLAIARRLDEALLFLGRETRMTRREDVSIYSDGAESLREKKKSDLKNRVALVNGIPGAVLVSIHQNSLPSVPSVHGAQVFYGSVPWSGELAASVQTSLNQCVNQAHEKHEKEIDPSVYLMKHVTVPAILVECGFLSNAAEAEMLQEPDHQKTLSIAIAAGLLRAEEGRTP